ncbi:MAG TPA: AraC family transcriptional regulator, partial [Myxococcaceae bacterium]|nr:AraC family transcriptional regulator [Myxococcaceae bacterium]
SPKFIRRSPVLVDPLAEVVTLLQPSASHAKTASGAGRWCVRWEHTGESAYCAILEGACCLVIDGREPTMLQEGDFVLVPSAAFALMSTNRVPLKGRRSTTGHVVLPSGEVRYGDPHAAPDVRMLGGYCAFGSPDASVLVELLPQFVHVRGEPRLATLMQLVKDENRAQRPARELVLARLLEVLFIEALRGAAGTIASPGLVRGLADERLALAIRKMHECPTKQWTIAQLAKEAGLSRSTFFERFSRALGVAPMEYLLGWRMSLAKKLLGTKEVSVKEIAEKVGYSSASTFSVAFARVVGVAPTHYARRRPTLVSTEMLA